MTFYHDQKNIKLLLFEAEQADDPRTAVRIVQQMIAKLNEDGQDIPEELVWMQNRYVDECISLSQGR